MGQYLLRFEDVTEEVQDCTFDCGVSAINEIIRKSYLAIAPSQAKLKSIYLHDNISGECRFLGYFLFTIRTIRWDCFATEAMIETGYFDGKFGAVHIELLAIDKKYQRKKIGTKIVEAVVPRLIECTQLLPIRCISLNSFFHLIEFYSKFGFKKTVEMDSAKNTLMYFDLMPEEQICALNKYFDEQM